MLIALVGDSWGYCWTGRGPDLGTLPGIQDILQDQGHSVIDLCQAGSANYQSLQRLTALTVQPDLIIFIQTEPIRDFYTGLCDPNNSARAIVDSTKIFEMADAHGGLTAAMRHWLRTNTYQQLSDLQQRFGVPIWLVGGCSCVYPKDVPDNVAVPVPSWSSLLIDSIQDSLFQNTAQWMDHEYSLLVRNSPVLLSDWFTETKITVKKILAWHQDQQYFNPDDWHPNYQGHLRLVQCLFNDIDS